MLRIRRLDKDGNMVDVELPLEYYKEEARLQGEIVNNWEQLWKAMQDYAMACQTVSWGIYEDRR